ncbi:folylpolyglutamate synthase/dihydrofolate synthase family protein [Candidatus Solincola tengchongensis]|uniref:bifunctional folylpolyglutamate synthase/dihydrofolate synthase n=1 Tax=Candidatus Solincola tengchongensis TaxID=2900693 RepID=UPI00257ACD06|nr:folylpolyglutamate synthase/dihydrofolate synthase family protein [Candidatus Solincola tengchongensis]
MMDFKEAEEYLGRRARFGIKPGLERIRLLLSLLGDPQLEFPSIHITGTNGKTSTARMVASILGVGGRKVGRYTSPHLQSVTERICVDGRPVTEREFASLLERVIPAVEESDARTGDPLTYFEVTTAMAFLHFARRKVDVGVIEVGLGGRWDATNLLMSQVQVITGVAFDHTAELGDTLERIAFEKAGIIKGGSAVISAVAHPGALKVIAAACKERGSELKLYGRDFQLIYQLTYGVETERIGQVLGIRGLLREYADLFLPLLGEHQGVNAACAVAACEAFAGSPAVLSADEVAAGLRRVTSPGRLEVVSLHPLVLLDGAHNPEGAFRLAQVIRNDLDYEKLVLVLGILEDKDMRRMLKILLPLADTVVFTQSREERAAPARRLARLAREMGYEGVVVEDIGEAVRFARTLASVSDMVCVTGSLYTVGEAREALGLRPE